MKVNNKVPPITAAKQISKKLQRKGVVQKSPREEIQISFFSFFLKHLITTIKKIQKKATKTSRKYLVLLVTRISKHGSYKANYINFN